VASVRQGANAARRRYGSVALIAIGIATARAAAPAPEEVLQRAIERLRAATRAFSRYACTETVERQYFDGLPASMPGRGPAGPGACTDAAAGGGNAEVRLEAVDRLRLEVTVSDGREIYSWPGATRFDTRAVSDIIREGPIGTGSFGTHLVAIFDNPGVAYEFAGEHTEGGRRLFEYRFHVPLDRSQYQLRMGGRLQTIAYDGSFLLDANSLALLRMTYRARELPPGSTICGLGGDLDYSGVQTAGSGFLLPSNARLYLAFESGRETANITTFSECRQYRAESEIVFDEGAAAPGVAAAPAQRSSLALPIGLPLRLALDAPIDTATAAAGDPVAARVVQAVRRPGSAEIVIPAGAEVRGRLTRVERHLLPVPYFLVAMSFNRLDWQGGSSRFAARSEGNPGVARELGVDLEGQGSGMRHWDQGVFLFPTSKSRYVIPAGYESKWMTLATRLRP
jgi:hypothetical protein